MPTPLSPAQLAADLAVRDLTEGIHAIRLAIGLVVDALATAWGCEVRWCRGDRIVTVADNYDNLGYASSDVTRDARYTRYVDENHMLRSHSSALVPAALRDLARRRSDDVLLVCPGIAYRRDSLDRLHTGTPHQLDLWRLSAGNPMTGDDLDDMIATVLGALLPGAVDRREPRVHPYTVAGRQVDVARDREWVEVAECGLAHPAVLTRAGLGASWTGLAMGMGMDRMVMLVKEIPDIRLLRSPDPAVAVQMTDLARYRPVSAMPPIRRDISLAVADDDVAEDLGDRVREALGADAAAVESVEILQETPCRELPPPALARLGADPDQKNVLVRIVLRHLHRTLSDKEANDMRDRVQAALHQGRAQQWASTKPSSPNA